MSPPASRSSPANDIVAAALFLLGAAAGPSLFHLGAEKLRLLSQRAFNGAALAAPLSASRVVGELLQGLLWLLGIVLLLAVATAALLGGLTRRFPWFWAETPRGSAGAGPAPAASWQRAQVVLFTALLASALLFVPWLRLLGPATEELSATAGGLLRILFVCAAVAAFSRALVR